MLGIFWLGGRAFLAGTLSLFAYRLVRLVRLREHAFQCSFSAIDRFFDAVVFEVSGFHGEIHTMAKLPPKSPRIKTKQPKAPTIVRYDLPEGTNRISKNIPDNIKLCIADAVMAYSEMEMSAETVIWDLTGLSMDDGRLLTEIEFKEKFELAKKFSERYRIPIHGNAQTSADIWTLIRVIVEARNKIAHGVWAMLDGKTPLAVSYRIDRRFGKVTGEHFPEARLKLIAEQCRKIRDLFDAMARHITSLPTRPEPQPPENSSQPS